MADRTLVWMKESPVAEGIPSLDDGIPGCPAQPQSGLGNPRLAIASLG
ncbi:hypothetical protein NG791_25080 [Laspinema sp. D1]|nr:hypothetical protein [Laspinema sp. D2b]